MNIALLKKCRAGHSLIELVAATICSVILLAGLGGVMFIARQIAYIPTASNSRVEAAEVLNQLADELRFATMITRYVDTEAEQSLEFVVADRDADGRAERIRYDWSTLNDPPRLYKTVLKVNEETGMLTPLDPWLIASTPTEGEDAGLPFHVELIETDPPQTPDRFTHATLRLQTGNAGHSHVNVSVPLLERPQLLAACWRTDFDLGIDPTSIDVNGNGVDVNGNDDWVPSGGASLDVLDGTWIADGNLATNWPNNFTATTIIEARCKNMAPSGPVDVLRINVNRQPNQSGGSYAPLTVRMQKQLDGSQTLTLYGMPTNSSEVILKAVDNLSNDYIRIRLIVRPAKNNVSLEINGIGDDVLGGPFTYPSHPPTSGDRCVKLFAGPQFDYVDVRVGTN
jgi:hypothetical protein